MKTDIHPELHDVVFIDSSSGAKFISQSTIKTDEKMKINGKDHYVIKVEISSDTHPFYTGKQKLIDTSGRVDKFRAKMKKAQELAEKNVKKVEGEDAEQAAKESAETTEETAETTEESAETTEETEEAAETTEETAETTEEAAETTEESAEAAETTEETTEEATETTEETSEATEETAETTEEAAETTEEKAE